MEQYGKVVVLGTRHWEQAVQIIMSVLWLLNHKLLTVIALPILGNSYVKLD